MCPKLKATLQHPRNIFNHNHHYLVADFNITTLFCRRICNRKETGSTHFPENRRAAIYLKCLISVRQMLLFLIVDFRFGPFYKINWHFEKAIVMVRRHPMHPPVKRLSSHALTGSTKNGVVQPCMKCISS